MDVFYFFLPSKNDDDDGDVFIAGEICMRINLIYVLKAGVY